MPMVEMEGMLFDRYHEFFEEFDRKFQQLCTGGFINFYKEVFMEIVNSKRYEHLHPGDVPKNHSPETARKRNFSRKTSST